MSKKITGFLLLLLGAAVCYPVFFLFIGSLMGTGELKYHLGAVHGLGEGIVSWSLLPLTPTLRHYVELLLDTPEFFHMFWNSTALSAGILAGQLLVGVPAAWGFAKYEFPLKKLLFTLYILLMMMPFQVTMLSSYLVLSKMQLTDTLRAVIFPCAFSTFPVFIMYRFFCGIPQAITDAAKIDGAGELAIFWHIGIPLGSSGIVSAVVLGFLESWNLIEQPLTFFKSKNLWPLSLYLPKNSPERAGISFAASVITLLPALFVFLCGQDYLEQGIVAAAVKE